METLYPKPLSEATVRTFLQNGKIPPGKTCIFQSQCAVFERGGCHHKGKEHINHFSCAQARWFNLVFDASRMTKLQRQSFGAME